jgi:hypothetical protein
MAKKTTAPEIATDPATFETVARKRIAAALDCYRAEVTKAAGNEPQSQEQLERVLEALTVLRYPESAWAADVAAVREYRKHEAVRAAEELAQPDYIAQGKALAEEIKRLEKVLLEKRVEHRTIERRPMRMVSAVQRQEDLKRERPHVFLPADVVVERIVGNRPTLKATMPSVASPQFVFPRVPAHS